MIGIIGVNLDDIVFVVLDSFHFVQLNLHHVSDVDVQIHQSIEYELNPQLLIHLLGASIEPANDLRQGQTFDFFGLLEFDG